jgi:hypothetical protein
MASSEIRTLSCSTDYSLAGHAKTGVAQHLNNAGASAGDLEKKAKKQPQEIRRAIADKNQHD